jgi:DNA-binding response OmpR family regulator
MVDDKVTLCFAMREYFNSHNYEVDCAHTVDDAMRLLNMAHYSVLIADLDLGGANDLDGFKVIKMAREQFPETRIVVLTAYGSVEAESEAQSLGANAFLHKPRPLSEVARIVFELSGDKVKD